jgi:pantetheine-phosphate adenylyltransferase
MNAIFPGSFDPIHEGHIDVIKRASLIFDTVYVCVSVNESKSNLSTLMQRYKNVVEVINQNPISNVKVTYNEGYTINAAIKYNCSTIIRGIRDQKDFIYEKEIAVANCKINNSIETLFMFASIGKEGISSTLAKQVQKYKKEGTK